MLRIRSEKTGASLTISLTMMFCTACLLLLFALSTQVYADDPSSSEYFDYIITDENEVEITGYSEDGPEDVIIPHQLEGYPVTSIAHGEWGSGVFYDLDIESVEIPESITLIGDYAFHDNRLARVSIPDGVITIGEGAFRSNGLTLTEVTMGSNVEVIGNDAFSYNNLNEIDIPHSVISIGSNAFRANQLQEITIGTGITDLGDYVFYANELTQITLPENVTSIGNHTFGNNQLEELTIPDSVIRIEVDAFRNCTELLAVHIPDSVEYIDHEAFAGCANLEQVSIGRNVFEIGSRAFAECYKLRGVYFAGDEPHYAAGDLFMDSWQLTVYRTEESEGWPAPGDMWRDRPTALWDNQTVIEPSLRYYSGTYPSDTLEVRVDCATDDAVIRYTTDGSEPTEDSPEVGPDRVIAFDLPGFIKVRAFKEGLNTSSVRNATYRVSADVEDFEYQIDEQDNFITITGYHGDGGEVVIPSVIAGVPVAIIGENAFRDQQKLSHVNLPESVVRIEDFAFRNCGVLLSVTMSDNVFHIGREAFAGCTSLERVTIGRGIFEIEYSAFADCPQLESVYFKGAPPLEYEYDLFSNSEQVVVYHLPDVEEWGTNFSQRPTALWRPSIRSEMLHDHEAGVFEFEINWVSGMEVVVEAKDDLADDDWEELEAIYLEGNTEHFSDPDWRDYPRRFYRLRMP